jgi:TRAP-type mannitol/chloroaromatic compound transport system permease small subunit
MRRFIDQVSSLLAVAGALAGVVLMFGITADVANRFLTGGSVRGLLELMETTMVFIVFLGTAYAEQTGTHVRMTLVTSVVPVRLAAAMRLIGMVGATLLVFWMTWQTALRGVESFTRGETQMGLMQWPLWPARLVIPLGLLFLALQLAFRCADSVTALRTGEPEPIAMKTPADHAAH